ncbi:MAG TPA: transcription antitermination factor NusB [Chloroflexia bacterium]|nr:transcription antitermination factor NusB [Chloroflexia bacterium]
MPSASRRQARIVALQTLYEIDSTTHAVAEVLERNLEEPTSESTGVIESLDADGRAFATMLVEGVLANIDELDRIIVGSAPNWPIDQMSRIDKGILRLAIFEILFDNKVPLKAAINEAVELGKRFGSDSSSRFINGVLGTIADMRQAQGRRKPQKNGEHQPAGAKSAIQNPQSEIVE